MDTLQERVDKAIRSRRDQVENMIDEMELGGQSQLTTLFVGWFKGMEDALREIVLDVEDLRARI